MKLKLIEVAGFLSLSVFIFVAATVQTVSANPSESPKYNNNPIVATVGDQAIRLDDLKTTRIHKLMLQLHEIHKMNLKKKIIQILKKQRPELASEKMPQVSEQDISNFYKNTPEVQKFGRLEKMRNEIRSYLEGALEETYIEAQYKSAVQKGWVEVFLTPPTDFHITVPVDTAQLRFNDGHIRPVFLLELSDFQCPFCKRVQGTLGKLRERYERQVQFGYRHFPLPTHKQAQALAEASECAGDQGRFWNLHGLFFTQSSIAADLNRLPDLAKQAGVKNLDEFKQCRSSGKYKEQVKNDIREAKNVGVQSTPSFLLGTYNPETRMIAGEMFSGAVPEDEFVRLIEKYLSKSNAAAQANH